MNALQAVTEALQGGSSVGVAQLMVSTGYSDRAVGEALRFLRRRGDVEIVGRVKSARGARMTIYRWKP